jgi:preprotein translocase subunit SecA
VSYSGGTSVAGAGALAAAAAAAASEDRQAEEGAVLEGGAQAVAAPVVEQRVVDEDHQLGRNDPCWCGSGKKFKKCHGA